MGLNWRASPASKSNPTPRSPARVSESLRPSDIFHHAIEKILPAPSALSALAGAASVRTLRALLRLGRHAKAAPWPRAPGDRTRCQGSARRARDDQGDAAARAATASYARRLRLRQPAAGSADHRVSGARKVLGPRPRAGIPRRGPRLCRCRAGSAEAAKPARDRRCGPRGGQSGTARLHRRLACLRQDSGSDPRQLPRQDPRPHARGHARVPAVRGHRQARAAPRPRLVAARSDGDRGGEAHRSETEDRHPRTHQAPPPQYALSVRARAVLKGNLKTPPPTWGRLGRGKPRFGARQSSLASPTSILPKLRSEEYAELFKRDSAISQRREMSLRRAGEVAFEHFLERSAQRHVELRHRHDVAELRQRGDAERLLLDAARHDPAE